VADVEFAAVVQEGTVDVGLDDVGHEVAVGVLDFLLDETLNF
jgi:phage gp36-like protein